jgi:hypothetical protein
MSLSVIRRFTTEDRKRLDASARRFADRHGIRLDLENLEPAEALDMHVSWAESQQSSELKRLKPLWQACRCRALKVKVDASITVGHGYVGYSVS